MPRKLSLLLAGLALMTGLGLGAGRAAAEIHPSSDILLPYFEVDVDGYGRNTLFAVVNDASTSVDLTIGVYSNWGIPVLELPLSLVPNQVQSVSLRDWISFGRLPGKTLTAAEVEHLKAALSGKPSPKDGLYYGTEVTRDRALGYVLIRTLGPRPDALWGDFFITDSEATYLHGDTLVNLDPSVETMGTCQRHLLRFLEGGAFSAGTEVFVWTGATGEPSPTPIYTGSLTNTTTLAYDESGKPLGTHRQAVLSTQLMRVADMGWKDFGWLDLRTPEQTFVGVRFATGLASAAFHSYCMPLDTGAHTGPAITLGKLTNGLHSHTAPGPVLPVGTPITWEYFVQNTGDVRLTNVAVTDFPDPGVVCPKNVLEPAETMVCTASGVAQGCQYRNYATAAGYSPNSERVSAEDIGYYYGDTGAAVALVTRVEGQDANTPPGPTMPLGATVHMTYEVTNPGKAALTGITVTDDTGMAVHCPGTTLAPGQSMVCTGTETATVGLHAHTGLVQATPPCGPALPARDLAYHTTPASSNPSIRLAKLVNGDDANTAPGPGFPVGTPLLWTYVVTNTGDVTLTQVQVTDSRGLAVTCPKTTLAPTESMTCTASGTAVAGPYSNLGTATGQPPTGPAVSATDPCYYHGFQGQIGLVKRTNGVDAPNPPGPSIAVGAAVTWTYVVTNTGDATLTGVTVADDHDVVVTCPKTELLPAESMTCTGQGTAKLGQYENTGIATGNPPSGPAVQASYISHYLGVQAGGPQGCTPGYWKNHADSWPPTGYSTSQLVRSVFTQVDNYPALSSATLLDALHFQGGPDLSGAAEILLRAAVAALLNSAHPGVEYPRTTAQVILDVETALNQGNRDGMITLAAALDADNNLGCPLN